MCRPQRSICSAYFRYIVALAQWIPCPLWPEESPRFSSSSVGVCTSHLPRCRAPCTPASGGRAQGADGFAIALQTWETCPRPAGVKQGSGETEVYRQTAGKQAWETVAFRADWHRRAASSLSPRRRLAPSAHADGSAPWGSQGWGLARVGLARVGIRKGGAREPHRSLPPSGTSGGFLDPMGASDFDPAAFRAQARFPRPALVRRFPGLCFSRVTSVPRIPG